MGLINPLSSAEVAPYLRSLRDGLGEAGYLEGQNVAIEYRWADGHFDRLPALAADLVQRKVDVIAATGGSAIAQAAKAATATIPIVFAAAIDPVKAGLVASLAHPGGNLTGISFLNTELMPKRFQLISDLVPEARAIGLLVHPQNPGTEQATRDVQEAAQAKRIQLVVLKSETVAEIDAAFASCGQLAVGGLVTLNDPLFFANLKQIAALEAHYGVAAILSWREFPDVGGLMSYGPNLADVARQQGILVGRILKGEKPADLPIQQPTKFELVVNLKTAKQLGLTVPQAILARANEVIE